MFIYSFDRGVRSLPRRPSQGTALQQLGLDIPVKGPAITPPSANRGLGHGPARLQEPQDPFRFTAAPSGLACRQAARLPLAAGGGCPRRPCQFTGSPRAYDGTRGRDGSAVSTRATASSILGAASCGFNDPGRTVAAEAPESRDGITGEAEVKRR